MTLMTIDEPRREYPPEVVSRIQAGIEVFDRFQPEWRGRVNPDTLRMASSYNCVVAQVTGTSYWPGLERLGLSVTDSDEKYGFCSGMYFRGTDSFIITFGDLDAGWRDAIAERGPFAPKPSVYSEPEPADTATTHYY